MLSSGTTAKATVSDTAVVLITADDSTSGRCNRATIVNEGSVAGFWSPDAGTTWARLPANTAFQVKWFGRSNLTAKRVASGSDLAGIWAWAE